MALYTVLTATASNVASAGDLTDETVEGGSTQHSVTVTVDGGSTDFSTGNVVSLGNGLSRAKVSGTLTTGTPDDVAISIIFEDGDDVFSIGMITTLILMGLLDAYTSEISSATSPLAIITALLETEQIHNNKAYITRQGFYDSIGDISMAITNRYINRAASLATVMGLLLTIPA